MESFLCPHGLPFCPGNDDYSLCRKCLKNAIKYHEKEIKEYEKAIKKLDGEKL